MNEVQRHYNQRRKRLRQRDPIFYLASDKDFFLILNPVWMGLRGERHSYSKCWNVNWWEVSESTYQSMSFHSPTLMSYLLCAKPCVSVREIAVGQTQPLQPTKTK